MKMRHISLKNGSVAGVIFLMLVSLGDAYAQNDSPGPTFGVKGGLTLSTLFVNDENIENSNWKVGYHAGLFVKAPLTNMLAIQPEVLYSIGGSKVTYGGTDTEQLPGIRPGEVRFNLNYVQVPVLLMVNIGALNIHAGPYVSYLLRANVKHLENSDLFNSSTLLELSESDFQRLDYGFSGGLGFDLQNAKLGIRYNHGLQQIGDGGIAGRIMGNARNAMGQVYIGFGF